MNKLEMEEIAKEDYERVIDEMRHSVGISDTDIREFERSAIIKKSMNLVRQKAD